MRKATLILIAGFLLLVISCENQNAKKEETKTKNKGVSVTGNNIHQIIFGIFCGECSGHCVNMYRFTSTGNKQSLFANYTNSYFRNQDNMIFADSILDKNKISMASDIINNIPDTLMNLPGNENTFACPDCKDGCGLYLETFSGNAIKKFYIDYQTSQLNGQIKKFAIYLSGKINKIKE